VRIPRQLKSTQCQITKNGPPVDPRGQILQERRPVHGEFLNAAKLKGLRILLGLPEWAISGSFWRI